MTHIIAKTQPWDHQTKAIEYALSNRSALWHMGMGTGKSKCVLDLVATAGLGKILVICPTAVLHVWPVQFQKHWAGAASELLILSNKDSIMERSSALLGSLKRCTPNKPLFAVVNYEAAWREPLAKCVMDQDWDLLVLDESHRIKAHDSKCSKFCARIRAHRKLALTGTPMPHSPLDIFGQYRTLNPDIFGKSWTSFRWKYADMGGPKMQWVKGYRNLDDLKKHMDLIRFEVKRDVLNLPPVIENDLPVQLGSAEQKHYDQMENLFVTEVKGNMITASNAMVKLLRLQQITSGFLPSPTEKVELTPGVAVHLGGKAEQIGTAKRQALTELLEDIGPEPVVVFARFSHDIAIIKDVAKAAGRTPGEVSGQHKDLADWDAGELDTLAVQMQAGSEGIDLTRARYVIWYSLGFSRGQYDQANARCHRPGQTQTVFVYRLLAEGTVDEKVAKALDKKAKVISEALYGEGTDITGDLIKEYGNGHEQGNKVSGSIRKEEGVVGRTQGS
jgi:SNF2 family DNA or RNA helicase